MDGAPRPAPWAAWLQRQWWQPRPTIGARALMPLAWLYGALAAWQRSRDPPRSVGVPVVVVGNLVVGGAGKTPTVIALVELLRRLGWQPGVVSRGYGRQAPPNAAPMPVRADSPASQCGDEPLLIHLRTRAPVWVGRDRVAAAGALLQAHPDIDIVVADDGLQHRRLARDAEVIVFDERGIGNGLLLPAGPLREAPGGAPPTRALVLYNAPAPSTAWPGLLAVRSVGGVMPLAQWWAGAPQDAAGWTALKDRTVLAAAGIAVPERFFSMLETQGLRIERLPLPDHVAYDTLPWPPGTPDVIVTEKDAVKLPPGRASATRVWVATLDFSLAPDFAARLSRLLPNPRNAP